MTQDRYILHIDINHCFAQIEELLNPQLKEVPMCVGGDEASRSGIVLARNIKAREYGVATAETLRDARRKCPDLVVVPPHFKDYMYYTNKVKEIFKQYNDRVESYGSDEAWLDITDSYHLFGKPYDVAYEIQKRVLDEVGLTVSVGVSFNKVFAKLGSDLIKPSGMVIITPYNFEDLVWPLPVEELLYVGRQTKPKLNAVGIHTIGDLANTPVSKLKRTFGIKGIQMWHYANGLDESEVDYSGHVDPPKSISNGTTPPKDIESSFEAKIIMQHLCDSIASRLRDEGFMANVVTLAPRDVNLVTFTRQRRLNRPIHVSTDILRIAMDLLEENYDFAIPLRSITVGVAGLVSAEQVPDQISLFENDVKEANRQEVIDKTIDALRNRFGYHVIKRASAAADQDTQNFDAKRVNVLYPGRKKELDASDKGVRMIEDTDHNKLQ